MNTELGKEIASWGWNVPRYGSGARVSVRVSYRVSVTVSVKVLVRVSQRAGRV